MEDTRPVLLPLNERSLCRHLQATGNLPDLSGRVKLLIAKCWQDPKTWDWGMWEKRGKILGKGQTPKKETREKKRPSVG